MQNHNLVGKFQYENITKDYQNILKYIANYLKTSYASLPVLAKYFNENEIGLSYFVLKMLMPENEDYLNEETERCKELLQKTDGINNSDYNIKFFQMYLRYFIIDSEQKTGLELSYKHPVVFQNMFQNMFQNLKNEMLCKNNLLNLSNCLLLQSNINEVYTRPKYLYGIETNHKSSFDAVKKNPDNYLALNKIADFKFRNGSKADAFNYYRKSY